MKIEITTLYKNSVSIHSEDFDFMFTIADTVVREEFKGQYRNFGGLQSNFAAKDINDKLEILLMDLSEKIIEINNLINEKNTPNKAQ
jgi:hypothetical protein